MKRPYSVGQITLATFLGTALPGMWMLSRNLREIEETEKAKKYFYSGIGLTLLNLALAIFLPESVPALAVSLPFVLVVRYLAERELKNLLSEHIQSGGKIASWWSSIGWGLLSLLVVCSVLIGILFLLPVPE